MSTLTPTVETADLGPEPGQRGGGFATFRKSALVRSLFRRKARIIGMLIIAVYLFAAFFGHVLLPAEALKPHPSHAFAAPSFRHLLGTDYEGVGVLDDLISGTAGVLMVGAGAAFVIAFLGSVIGIAAGYMGGIVDTILMRFTDVVLSLPGFPLLLVIATILKSASPLVLIIMLGAVGWGGLARAERSLVLSFRGRAFVEAARGLQLSRRKMMGRVLFPNLASYIFMHFLLAVTGSIYAEVGLLFLGAAPFSSTNWGVMLSNASGTGGAIYDPKSAMYLFAPIIAILLLQGAVVAILGGVDELFNPRLREEG